MAALNAGDNQALFDTMYLPRVRISGDGVAIYAFREDLEKNYLGDAVECLPAKHWLRRCRNPPGKPKRAPLTIQLGGYCGRIHEGQDMVNVMIVEDEGLFRDLLKISLAAVPNMEVVGAVADGNAAIDAATRYNPDVILMDIELGSDPNGISTPVTVLRTSNRTWALSYFLPPSGAPVPGTDFLGGVFRLVIPAQAVGKRRRGSGPGH